MRGRAGRTGELDIPGQTRASEHRDQVAQRETRTVAERRFQLDVARRLGVPELRQRHTEARQQRPQIRALDRDRPLHRQPLGSLPRLEAGLALRVSESVSQLRCGVMPCIQIRRHARGLHPSLERLALGTGRCRPLDLDDHVLDCPHARPHATEASTHHRSQNHGVLALERETDTDGRGRVVGQRPGLEVEIDELEVPRSTRVVETQTTVLDENPRDAEIRRTRRGCFATLFGLIRGFIRLGAIEEIRPVVATVLIDAQGDRGLDQHELAELDAPLQQWQQCEPEPRVPRGEEIPVTGA